MQAWGSQAQSRGVYHVEILHWQVTLPSSSLKGDRALRATARYAAARLTIRREEDLQLIQLIECLNPPLYVESNALQLRVGRVEARVVIALYRASYFFLLTIRLGT